jgi:CBS domain-containing protein
MPIDAICTRDVMCTGRDTTVSAAARMMRERHVGDLIVVDEVDGGRVPVGIVTDRDIVLGVISLKLDPDVFTVGDLLNGELVTAADTQGIFETIEQMRIQGVRRMPIVDEKGYLVGIVSLDDLVRHIASELNKIANLMTWEQEREELLRT